MALITCPECGKEISASATTCPNCGHPMKQINKTPPVKGSQRPKKKSHPVLIIIGVIIAIAIIGGVFGSSDDDDEVKDVTPKENSQEVGANPNSESEKTYFSLGEVAEQKKVQVSLVNTIESNGNEWFKPADGYVYVICEFEITNNSDKDITISSVMDFDAYCDDYSINQTLSGLSVPEVEGKNSLDGSVASGKKLNGIIAYEVPATYQKLEVDVTLDFWSDKDIKFLITK